MANLGDILFADDRMSGILKSTNHGVSWENANTGLPKYYVVCMTTIGNEIIAGEPDGKVYRSNDSARTWWIDTIGLPINAQISFLSSVDTELLAGFYGCGIFRSFDSGTTWSECNQGLINTSVNAISSTGDTAIVGTNAGVFLSSDDGLSWKPKRNGLTDYNIASILIDGENLYSGSQGGTLQSGVFLSTDRGESWSFPDSGQTNYYIYSMIRSGNNILVGGGYDGLFWSSNNGLRWKNSLHGSIIEINHLIKLGSKVIAATNNGVYISKDNGETCSSSNNGFTYSQDPFTNSLVSFGSKVFLSRIGPSTRDKGALFVSDDTGSTWYRIADTSVPSKGIVKSFAKVGTSLFISTDSQGIYLTTDDGAHWTSENLGLADSDIISLAVQGNELLAGTASSGVWRRPLAEMISASSVASKNPSSETISVYPDPASSLVTVDCPDMKGAIDARLISITGITVWHKTINVDGKPFHLDLTGIANGSYTLELGAEEIHQSKNIVLKHN